MKQVEIGENLTIVIIVGLLMVGFMFVMFMDKSTIKQSPYLTDGGTK